MARNVRFTEQELRDAIRESRSWSDVLRRLGYRPAGGNHRTVQKYAARWAIASNHFDPDAARREARNRPATPLDKILVEHSAFSRGHLKVRLYREGVKQPVCELCGQGEDWHGQRMAMILDHINGIYDDNRLENLRIVCPNCAATLATHCGRKNLGLRRRFPPGSRTCEGCGVAFAPSHTRQKFCSRSCWQDEQRKLGRRALGVPNSHLRRVERPEYAELIEEVDRLGYLATGRRYGVSDNAIRKWIRQYERERAIAEGRDPSLVEIPQRTWPNMRSKRDAA